MNQVILAVGFGIVASSILALATVGFTIQLALTNIFNFAFGDVMTLSMFVAYDVNVSAHQSIWLAVAAGAAVGAVASAVLNLTIVMPFLRRGASLGTMLIVTLAVSIGLQATIQAIFGPQYRSYARTSPHIYRWLGMEFTGQQLVIIVIGIACMFGIHALLRYTQFGKAMRATSGNAALARSCGVPTARVTLIAWSLSGALAGAGAVVLAINTGSFNSVTGQVYFLVILSAAVFGGVGQAYGAMLGAFVVGMVSEIAAIWIPDLKALIAFSVLCLMLLVRPNGLIATASARTEASAQ